MSVSLCACVCARVCMCRCVRVFVCVCISRTEYLNVENPFEVNTFVALMSDISKT